MRPHTSPFDGEVEAIELRIKVVTQEWGLGFRERKLRDVVQLHIWSTVVSVINIVRLFINGEPDAFSLAASLLGPVTGLNQSTEFRSLVGQSGIARAHQTVRHTGPPLVRRQIGKPLSHSHRINPLITVNLSIFIHHEHHIILVRRRRR